MLTNPILLAATIIAPFLVVAGLVTYQETDDNPGDANSTAPSETPGEFLGAGEPGSCSDTPRSHTAREGSRFELVGRLETVNGGSFEIATPEGPVPLTLAVNAEVEGRLQAGDWINVTGGIAPDGEWVASDVSSACGEESATAEAGSPSPQPSPAAPPTAPPEPTPSPGPPAETPPIQTESPPIETPQPAPNPLPTDPPVPPPAPPTASPPPAPDTPTPEVTPRGRGDGGSEEDDD